MNKNILLLEARIRRLEKLVSEKSVNRGEPSNAFLVWQFLMDNGPSSSAAIKDSFPPSKRATIASVLTNALKDDCIRKQGALLVANPDYNWDDVGIINKQPTRNTAMVRRNNKIVEPIETLDEEPADIKDVPETPVVQKQNINRIGSTAIVNAIFEVLDNMKARVKFLDQLESGFTVVEALKTLSKRKQAALSELLGLSFDKLIQSIIRFGTDKFTSGLATSFKRKGIHATPIEEPDEFDDWDDYSGGDGYNNKSFDYYNNDTGMW